LEEVEFASEGVSFKAPHFVMYVKQQLEDRYGESLVGGGLKVHTTLDLELQEEAQKQSQRKLKSRISSYYQWSCFSH